MLCLFGRRDEQKAKGQGLVVVEAAQAMAGRRSRPLICLRSMCMVLYSTSYAKLSDVLFSHG
jgi:hypothetical protein